MKPISDILQILLSLPGWYGYAASLVAVLLLWQCWKSVLEVFGLVRFLLLWAGKRLVRPTWGRIGFACLLALPVYFVRGTIVDQLQYLEQVLQPAYVSGDTSLHALALYEAGLDRHLDTYEAAVVRRRTREIAAKIGCSPLAIYEVAHSECGLNPFEIRKDGIAAGWIQFTRVGATGITTLEQVKAACKRRDVTQIMDWTEAYLIDRAKGQALTDATAVYVCVFAPGFVGRPDETVLYEGYKNPAYFKNAIFDGYYVQQHADGRRQIFRSESACDGRITIGEMRLHLEAKKARFLNLKR